MSINNNTIKADYIIIGCGASGLNFVDVMLSETSNLTFVYVEKRALPGGHWVDSYDFIRLHMRSSLYGVPSTKLLEDQNPNVRRATGAQIKAYWQNVLEKHLKTERVKFMSQYMYNHDTQEIESLVGAPTYKVEYTRKLVDTSFLTSPVPSVSPPNFKVNPKVRFCPVNGIAKIHGWDKSQRPKKYCIIGAGKTGMDSVCFLLRSGVHPDTITWIRPRDTWLFVRDDSGRVGSGGFNNTRVTRATSVDNFFLETEKKGGWLRIDPYHNPEMWRGAAISPEEIELCRRVKNVIRLGRVTAITENEIVLEKGSILTDSDTLHVNCSSHGLTTRKPIQVFSSDRITIQIIFAFQPALGASIIGYIESQYHNNVDFANQLAVPLAYPKTKQDYFAGMRITLSNVDMWEKYIYGWLTTNRLYFAGHLQPLTWATLNFFNHVQHKWKNENNYYGTEAHLRMEEIYLEAFPNGDPNATPGWGPGEKLEEVRRLVELQKAKEDLSSASLSYTVQDSRL